MAQSRYPTTLADIQYHLRPSYFQHEDESCRRTTNDDGPILYNIPSLYVTLKSLRKRNISIRNRLTSILKDTDYVRAIALKYPSLPIIANRRNGNWYVPPLPSPCTRSVSPSPPSSSSQQIRHAISTRMIPSSRAFPSSSFPTSKHDTSTSSVYFKSTDGHFDQWAFSLRRLNLHLLDILGEQGGAVVVDVTASGGKHMPDALRWTVPVWATVINGVLFPEWDEGRYGGGGVPGWYGSAAENGEESVERTLSKINGMSECWMRDFRQLGLDLEALRRKVKRPIRIVWEVNGLEQRTPENNDNEGITISGYDSNVNVLVLCSASRSSRQEDVETGYIQGAADDAETWAQGLTPDIFWGYHDLLLACPEDEISHLIHKLVADANTGSSETGSQPVLIKPTKLIYIAEESHLSHLMPGSDAQTNATGQNPNDFDLIISCHRTFSAKKGPTYLNLDCRTGKLGSRDLRDKLPSVLDNISRQFTANNQIRILIACESGKDLSIGVALAILCRFFDDNGQLQIHSDPEMSKSDISPPRLVDKMLTRRRLAWISGVKPDVSPSRSTLQAVNSVLMDPPH